MHTRAKAKLFEGRSPSIIIEIDPAVYPDKDPTIMRTLRPAHFLLTIIWLAPLLAFPTAAHAAPSLSLHSAEATPDVPLWTLIPFVCLLLCIALMPFIHRHFWEHYYPVIALGLGAIIVLYYLVIYPDRVAGAGALLHTFYDYVAFISLIGSLFIIAGGIVIYVRRAGTPWINSLLLFTGAAVANVLGTTGASMVLIRPYLRMNRERIKPYHVMFFIFLVSNIGGVLTPIGDPPLFLGYLAGVPFFWLIPRVWLAWLVAVAVLTAVFYVLDRRDVRRHAIAEPLVHERSAPGIFGLFGGSFNFAILGVVIAAVLLSPVFGEWGWSFQVGPAGHQVTVIWPRELLMLGAAVLSFTLTRRLRPEIHAINEFNFAPVKEVALLFAGIFLTMIPALQYLEAQANHGPLGALLNTPGKFYWLSGLLSSVLDNAPTYLTFMAAAMGLTEAATVNGTADAPGLLQLAPQLVVAISLGAVFMGANTYIGNAPNFMVKTISEQTGVPMPSFLGAVLRYTLPFLLPVFVLIWALFLAPFAPFQAMIYKP